MPAPVTIVVRGTNRIIEMKEGTRVTAGRAADCEIQIDDGRGALIPDDWDV